MKNAIGEWLLIKKGERMDDKNPDSEKGICVFYLAVIALAVLSCLAGYALGVISAHPESYGILLNIK